MARSTGPILAAGAITWANQYLLPAPFNRSPEAQIDLFTVTTKVGVATGIAAGLLFLLEEALPDLAVILSWAAVLTVLMVRLPPDDPHPTPLERALSLV